MHKDRIKVEDTLIIYLPKLKTFLHKFQRVFSNLRVFGERRIFEENIIPDFICHFFRLDFQRIFLVPFEGIALQEVRYGVVCVVDRRV